MAKSKAENLHIKLPSKENLAYKKKQAQKNQHESKKRL